MIDAQWKRCCSVRALLFSTLLSATALYGFPAFAQSETARDGKLNDVRDKYIEKLEARIRSLEKEQQRVNALEKKLDALSSQLASRTGPIDNADSKRGGAETNQKKPAASPDGVRAASAQAPAGAAGNQPAGSATDKPADSRTGPPPALAAQEDQDALRDLQVVRDQAVTVKQGGLDLSVSARYIRATTQLQFSRAAIGAASLRYGLFPGVEVSATVPYYYAFRSTEILPGGFAKNTIADWGDVGGQITATLWKETIDTPGIYGYAGFTAPTGPNPYWIEPGEKPFAQPVNPLWFTQSAGHWSYTVGGTLVKTLEPIIVFGGVSYTRFIPDVFAGSKIEPGERIGWSAGIGLAVSEKTTLGTAVTGAFVKDLVMDGSKRYGSAAEAVNVTMSLTQRIASGFFVEPSVSFGLTNDAPQAMLALGMRKTFNP
jgi:hypothetical protein